VDEENENPVANGLVALVAVGLVIGLLTAIIALLGTRLVGLGGDGGTSGGGVAAGDSLYLPSLVPTELDSRMLVTLAPVESETPADSSSPSASASTSATASSTPSTSPSDSALSGQSDTSILLNAGSSRVEVGDELMLSGTFRRGEGSVLDIWYNVDGEGWTEFNLDVNVYGGVFQVHVATYKTGTIQWRVEDPDSGLESNVVTVHHGDD
jgi:hypothetical protein